MKERNQQIAELIGISAVIISLLFVAYQIQQANRIALATAEIEIRNNYASLNELVLSNPDLNRIFLTIRQNPEDLTELDLIILESWVFRLTNLFEAIESAYDNGLASETTYLNMLEDARNNLQYEVLRSMFSDNINRYSQSWDFIQYMQDVIAEYD